MATALNLNQIVDVVVNVSPVFPTRSTFNHGLIIGTTTVIPTSERLRLYTSTNDMLTDGFLNSSPEFVAAEKYFGQSPAPLELWVGRQDTTAATPETPLVAVEACRLANNDWYTCMVCGSSDSDQLAIAAYIQTATPASTYFFTTNSSNVLNNNPGNVMETLKGLKYNRILGLYSTQTVDAVAALLGVAMGLNTGLANSAYTLKFKSLVGDLAEPLTQTQVNNIETNNGNVYVNYQGGYTIAEQGAMANGQFFDEVINLDMLSNNIQLNVMNLLISNPKIPLTDAGVTQIMRSVNSACDQAVTVGFLAPGTWEGVQVLNLNTGDPVPKGYVTQSPPVSSLTIAQRTARQSPPIYVSITEAGAVHSVTIGVYVQR